MPFGMMQGQPQGQPYMPVMPMAPMPPAQQNRGNLCGVPFVNGIDEVRSTYLRPGQSALFFDCNKDSFYIKEVDQSGRQRVDEYPYTKAEPVPQDGDFITKEYFDNQMAEVRNQYESIIQAIRQSAGDATAGTATSAATEQPIQPGPTA